jgi:hypothetical protein
VKTNLFSLILILFIFRTATVAQNGKPVEKKFNMLSVKNSDGQLVNTSRDTIARSFFLTTNVTVHSTQPLASDEIFMCVLQRMDGVAPSAYTLNGGILPEELKRQIKRTPSGTLVTFMVTMKKGSGHKPDSYALHIVLK